MARTTASELICWWRQSSLWWVSVGQSREVGSVHAQGRGFGCTQMERKRSLLPWESCFEEETSSETEAPFSYLRSILHPCFLQNEPRATGISPNKTYRWLTNTGKDDQHHSLSEKCKSKPQWGTNSRWSEWLLSKYLQTINAREGVEKREPSYTVSVNAN